MFSGMRGLFRFVKRLFAYLPILWSDEDWDYMYLMRLIQFKITRMREHMQKHGHHTQVKKMFRRMQIVETLIDRIEHEDYGRPEYFEWVKRGELQEEFHKVLERVVYSENNDWNMVFDIIRRYGRKWWD